MVGKTERTLYRNIIQPMQDLMGMNDVRVNHGTGEGTILGRPIHLAGASDIRAEGKIRGLTLAGIYGDEVTLYGEEFFRMLMTRLSIEGAKAFFTTNPDGPQHWLKKFYLDREHELDMSSFHFGLHDNPWLPPSYVANLELEYTGLWRKRYIDGLWVAAEGAIYPNWDETRYCYGDEADVMSAQPVDANKVWLVTQPWHATDYGDSVPFVTLAFGIHERKIGVLAEYRHDPKGGLHQVAPSQQAERVVGWTRRLRLEPEWWYVDPSAAGFQSELRALGVDGVRDADNDVREGIRTVSSLMARDLLRVHRSCVGLREEFPGYVWDSAAQARGEDAPIKVDDHSLDTLRYGLMSNDFAWKYLTEPDPNVTHLAGTGLGR